MKAIHKITLLLLLFPVLSFAGITKGKYLKEKKNKPCVYCKQHRSPTGNEQIW